MNPTILTTVILLAIGSLLISIAALRTYHLVQLLAGQRFHRRWEFLFILMLLFIAGYLISIWFILSDVQTNLFMLMGGVFFAGAIFVLLVVNTGFLTLNDLFKTTVSKDYVENVIGSMADTLIVMQLDDSKKIITVNKATTLLLNYNNNEIEGISFSRILGEPGKTDDLIDEIIKNGSVIDREILYVKNNGEKVPVLFSGSALRDINGKVDGIVCVGHDISERKKAQEALESANSMKELLLDILTHDLKNPVGVIEGVVEILRKDEPERNEYSMLHNSIQSLFKVIKNATTLSRVAMSEKISKKSLDLAELTRVVLAEYQSSITYNKMEVINNVPEQLEVQANPILVEVIKNYLSNALKYAVDGKKLIIDYTIDEGYHIFSFKDFGDTIPAENRESIFNRRMQQKQHVPKETGLGLAIVKRIMIAHGGDAWVLPNEPKGNIFYFSLPYA